MGKSITDMCSVTAVGLELAGHVFQVHGVDTSGRVVVAKAISNIASNRLTTDTRPSEARPENPLRAQPV